MRDFELIPPENWYFKTSGDVRNARARADQYFAKHGSFRDAGQEIEEFVRQWALTEPVNRYGHSPESIFIESKLGPGEADIVVVNHKKRPILVIETKRRGVRRHELERAEQQLRRYLASAPPGTVGMITDGSRQPTILRKGIGNTFTYIKDIPAMRTPALLGSASRGYWKDILAYTAFYDQETTAHDRRWREAFVRAFPERKIARMSLEEYAQGRGATDSFCYRLEFHNDLGLITGGSAQKWGVYWMKKEQRWWYDDTRYTSPEDALRRIKAAVLELLETAEAGHFDWLDEIAKTLGATRWPLRTKPLHFYFPEQFLPIHSEPQLLQFMQYFDLTPGPTDGVITLNRTLLRFLRSLPEFQGFETQALMSFLYNEIALHNREPISGRRSRERGMRLHQHL